MPRHPQPPPAPDSPAATAAVSLARAPFNRRQFLTGSAALALGAVIMGQDHQITELLSDLGGPSAGAAEVIEAASAAPIPDFTFSVDRETDLTLLDFAFYGFTANRSGPPGRQLVTALQATSSSNVVTVRFPPQAIGEAAYNFEAQNVPPTWYVDPPPVLSVMAAPSRLCFTLDSGSLVEFPTMSAADLLDWSTWTLLVPAGAQVTTPQKQNLTVAKQTDPTLSASLADLVTYIEYPYALYLAPSVYIAPPVKVVAPGSRTPQIATAHPGFSTSFTGRPTPLSSPRNFSDCWTADLSQTVSDGGASLIPQGAAVWTRDFTRSGGDATPEIQIDYEA